MIEIAIFLPALAGLILLMLAMKRHQQDWLRRTLSARTQRALRGSGAAAVALALFVAGALSAGWRAS